MRDAGAAPRSLITLFVAGSLSCLAASASAAGAVQDEQGAPREFKLLASDGTEGDELALQVAISDSTVIVGASGEDEKGDDAGTAYIYQGNVDTWVEVAKLNASDGAEQAHFGRAVALSGDFSVVGAPFADSRGTESGGAYMFERIAGAWPRVETAKLVPVDAAAGDHFGMAVAVSGNTLVVGAPLAAVAGRFSGAAYIFERGEDGWTEAAKLTASDGAANDRFGLSVAALADTVVVGAPFVGGHGAAYVFERGAGGWTETAELSGSDGETGDMFAGSVAISAGTIVVGASGDDDQGATSGSVYVFERAGEGWAESAKLTSDEGSANDLFGYSVAVEGDIIVVGANGDDDSGNESGSVHIFRKGDEGWEPAAKLTASDGAAEDLFGISVSVSGDRVAVGAKGNDDNGNESGSAYVFVGIGG